MEKDEANTSNDVIGDVTQEGDITITNFNLDTVVVSIEPMITANIANSDPHLVKTREFDPKDLRDDEIIDK